MGMLEDFRLRRNSQYTVPRNYQALADNAPVGSVGAAGGLYLPQSSRGQSGELGGMLSGVAMMPGPLGDVTGPLADAYMYYNDPSSRTITNYGLSALGALPFIPSLATAFHGSAKNFDMFDNSKIGTGEGNQAFGWGTYLAENQGIGKQYQLAVTSTAKRKELGSTDPVGIATDFLSTFGGDKNTAKRAIQEVVRTYLDKVVTSPASETFRKIYEGYKEAYHTVDKIKDYNKGTLYKVDVPDEAVSKMLLWDKPLSEQPKEIIDAIDSLDKDMLEDLFDRYNMTFDLSDITGKELYQVIKRAGTEDILPTLPIEYERALKEDERASLWLNSMGIPGIKYLDAGSRVRRSSLDPKFGEKTYNYVIFDDKLIKIKDKKQNGYFEDMLDE